MMSETLPIHGPFGLALDSLAREVGSWPADAMVFAVEVIGNGEDPQVMLTGGKGDWRPLAKRWNFSGHDAHKAVIRFSEYRAGMKALHEGAAA